MSSTEQKKQKILAVIASRGWCSADLYFAEAKELLTAGLIKRGERYTVGGNPKVVWVAA